MRGRPSRTLARRSSPADRTRTTSGADLLLRHAKGSTADVAARGRDGAFGRRSTRANRRGRTPRVMAIAKCRAYEAVLGFDGWDGSLKLRFVSVRYIRRQLSRGRMWVGTLCALLAGAM